LTSAGSPIAACSGRRDGVAHHFSGWYVHDIVLSAVLRKSFVISIRICIMAPASSSENAVRPPREMMFQEGTSNKFWRIELAGSSHTVTFGKVGTNGQTQTKEFDSDADAAKSYDKLVAEKLKKGYQETGSSAAAKPQSAATPVVKEKPAAKVDGKVANAGGKAAKSTAAKSAPAEQDEETDDSGVGARPARELVFQDGSSHKFWRIELSGASHTVTFGKVGTDGQTQTKEFDSEAEAAKSYDKLVAEKIKKGYEDSGTAAPAATRTPVVKSAATAKSAPEPAAPAARAPAKPVQTDVVREFRFAEIDWILGRDRGKTHKRSEPQPFDLEKCLERLSRLKTETYGWVIRWQDLNLPSGLDPQEAHFWLEAMSTNRTREDTPKLMAGRLKSFKAKSSLTLKEIQKLLERQEREFPEEIGIVLGNLLPAEDILTLWLDTLKSQKRSYMGVPFSTGMAWYVIPYWTDAERKAIARKIRGELDPSNAKSDPYEALPLEFYVASAIGMSDEVAAIVSTWERDRYGKSDWDDHYQRPQELVFGLGSPERILSEWRRLRLKMRRAAHVRTFLSATGVEGLDCVRDSIVAVKNKELCDELLGAFCLVVAPEAAPHMLECKLSAKSPTLARQWLDENVGCAVAGLIDTAAGRGKLADAAVDYLRVAKRNGHKGLIEAALKSASPEVASRIRQEVLDHTERVLEPLDEKSTPAALKKAFAGTTVKALKPPAWAGAAELPPIVLGDHQLNPEQMATVLSVLAATPVTTTHPLLAAIRELAEPRSLDEFTWRLFQNWIEAGATAKEKWAMGAIGHLGSDGAALKLTPLVRNWPGESQHQRAVFGLECLRAIGSNVALMQLSGIAQKLKFKGLKTKAEEFVTAIAKDRGLTRAELEDRVVPDCGLDEQGKREFSFGARSFEFLLGPELKPMVRDSDGKIRDDLPKPTSKDDAEQSKNSVEEWKLLKKQIKEVAKIQAGRLEQAMVTGRRWKVDEFKLLLVNHPLMTHLVRKLLWGAYDDKSKLLTTFRVTDERDFADVNEDSVSLKSAASVGVVHPLHMAESDRSAWGEVLGDYEIVPPFAQLGRPVHALEAGEGKATSLERFKGMKLVAPTLVFGLEKLGWIRGLGMDGGGFDEHSKQFPAAGVTAVVNYDGTVGMGYIDPNEMLEVTTCQFVKGMRGPSGYGYGDKEKLIALKDVDPIVISEVIADLNELKAKAK